MLYNLVLAIHVIIAVVLIIVVLMQSSKGGGLAGAFGGGGGDQTLFGGQETASFLSRATWYLAISFMLLSVVLAFLASKGRVSRPRSAVRDAAQSQGNIIPAGQTMDQLLSGATDTLRTEPADTTR